MDCLLQRYKGKLNNNVRILLAELMGTFILMMFGIGSVASAVLGKGSTGTFLSINFGWGIGCALGVYLSAGVSGGHINPAVSLAMVVCGRLNIRKLPFYFFGQFFGALIASAICFGVYNELIFAYENNGDLTMKTAGIFSTYPNKNVHNKWTAFGDQVIGTMLLVGCICALTDKRNNPPSSGLLPLIIGLVVFVIGVSFGMNCGYGINPARDFVPRLFTAMAGWGLEPFKTRDHWFWVPVLGQFIGGIIGAIVYIITVELHHPVDEEYEVEMHALKVAAEDEKTGLLRTTNIDATSSAE